MQSVIPSGILTVQAIGRIEDMKKTSILQEEQYVHEQVITGT